MPAWWGKRSSKSKEVSNQDNSYGKNDKKIFSIKENMKRCSLDEAALRKNSPRGSKELSGSGGSSGFSGFDSDSAGKRGLPLPEPCVSDLGAGGGIGAGGGVGFASGSGSVSSVSSSGSSGGEDHDNNQGCNIQFGGCRLVFR